MASLSHGGIVEDQDQEQERERVRSPNYPAFGLRTAIERIQALYKQDKKAAVPTVAAVRAWGYTSLNGRSMRALGALRQYGLLEDTANKMVKLSPVALTILLAPQGSPERARALQEAAWTPPIFAKLHDEYGGEFPSDESMVHRLAGAGNYSEEAARGLIAALRDTISLVEESAGNDTSREYDSSTDEPAQRPSAPDQTPKRKEAPMPDTGRESFDITLPMQMGGQAFLRLPRSMNEREFDMLKTLIDVMLTNMKEALVTSPTPDPKNGP